ncbi:MAG TPA: PH domain-containing protein [Candidatus Saccharimonadales bacterium]|nr:PH domain-containing protein [Candidatus Saccharimonadales bacterium]
MPPSTDPATPAVPPADPPPITDRALESLLEPGEHTIVVVHRHPIGLIIIYLEAILGLAALAALAIFVAPDVFNDLSTQTNRLIIAGTVFAVAMLVFVLFVATYVYRQSRLLVTDRSLVQVLQKSLFIRGVSRLSMSNVEDVTAEQRGILATIFNFGTLTVQTAGEEDNFVFPTCPDPNQLAHRILEARQAYAQSLEEMDERRRDGRR